MQASATARKLSAVAAFIGVRPEPGGELAESGGLPAVWDEFAAGELALVLAESRDGAEKLLGFSHALRVKLPGTLAALRAGEIREAKAWIMACARPRPAPPRSSSWAGPEGSRRAACAPRSPGQSWK